MASHNPSTLMHGRIPAAARSTTRVYPIDFAAADPIPGPARRRRLQTSTFDAAEQAAALNAVLISLNALLAEGGAHA